MNVFNSVFESSQQAGHVPVSGGGVRCVELFCVCILSAFWRGGERCCEE